MTATIEAVRKFWDARPCNVRHSTAPIGSQRYYQEVANRRYKVEPHIHEFAGFGDCHGKSVLEVGCGIGTDAIQFALNGANVVAMDLSDESLRIARQNAISMGVEDRVRFINWNIEDEWLPSTFDVVYSFGALHHTPDPEKALRNISKNMDGNSILKIMLYAKNSWKSAMIDAGLDQFEAQAGCPIAHRYEGNEAGEMLVRNGFRVLSIRLAHIFKYNVEHYTRGDLVVEPWFRDMPAKMFEALSSRFGWHLLITAKKKT